MLIEELNRRNLPNVLQMNDGTKVTTKEEWAVRRKEIRNLLCNEFCGYTPDFPTTVEAFITKEDENSFGGKAVTYELDIRCRSPFAYFAFPCSLTIPKGIEKPAVFLTLTFTPTIADGLGEEILDHGYAIASVYYQDIAPDKEDDFEGGVGRFCNRNRFDSWGKIGMWAWGTSRIMDYLQTLSTIDTERIAVIGHSRLGKAALWSGAMDERFSLVISNDSGGGGAALFRGKTGEKIVNLSNKGSNCWFCGNFFRYNDLEDKMPFDQHFLLSLVAPRHLYVCSASEDAWADPLSEFLSCVATTPVYEILGEIGLITPDSKPKVNEYFHEGKIGYHLRGGTHYLSRFDWQKVMEYRKKHMV